MPKSTVQKREPVSRKASVRPDWTPTAVRIRTRFGYRVTLPAVSMHLDNLPESQREPKNGSRIAE